MGYKCLVLAGDGIGPEVTTQAELVLRKVAKLYQLDVRISFSKLGGAAIESHNDPCPSQTLELAAAADAILLGAVGGPQWDNLVLAARPESGLLKLRSEFGFFANYRPARIYPSLAQGSPLRPGISKGLDILILRELVGGLYFGKPRGRDGDEAYNTMRYTKEEIVRLAHLAFLAAGARRGKVCSVDKANVLEVSVLWREAVNQVASNYPDVELSHLYVDNAAMQLVARPASFDVIITENLFGDILSDLAAQLVGSIGVLPSASLNNEPILASKNRVVNGKTKNSGRGAENDNPAAGGKKGLYEPVHGSAPDIAGQNKANPIASILSVAMMLRHSFAREEAAQCIETAVTKTLDEGLRTEDLLGNSLTNPSMPPPSSNPDSLGSLTESSHSAPQCLVGCEEMGAAIRANINR